LGVAIISIYTVEVNSKSLNSLWIQQFTGSWWIIYRK